MRATSPPRRRSGRSAPSGFIAYYTDNYTILRAECVAGGMPHPSVSDVSKYAALKYNALPVETRSSYSMKDVYFFKDGTADPKPLKLDKEKPSAPQGNEKNISIKSVVKPVQKEKLGSTSSPFEPLKPTKHCQKHAPQATTTQQNPNVVQESSPKSTVRPVPCTPVPNDKPSTEPTDKQMDKSVEKQMDKPVDRQMDKPEDKQMEKSTEESVDKMVADRPVEDEAVSVHKDDTVSDISFF